MHSLAKVLPRFILCRTPPVNLLAFLHQPGDTVLVVLRPASPRATTPQTQCQKSLPTRHDIRHAAHSSLWQPCHNQHKSLSVSTRSKGIMVLERGGREKEGRHTKYWSWYCHLWLRDQAASVNVTVHTRQSDKRKANSCSSFCPECCGFYITQEEVGRSHAHIQRKEEKENNPHQDLCPNGAHYCNYKAQISDQALRWLG